MAIGFTKVYDSCIITVHEAHSHSQRSRTSEGDLRVEGIGFCVFGRLDFREVGNVFDC